MLVKKVPTAVPSNPVDSISVRPAWATTQPAAVTAAASAAKRANRRPSDAVAVSSSGSSSRVSRVWVGFHMGSSPTERPRWSP